MVTSPSVRTAYITTTYSRHAAPRLDVGGAVLAVLYFVFRIASTRSRIAGNAASSCGEMSSAMHATSTAMATQVTVD
jgi:hypothetical protein